MKTIRSLVSVSVLFAVVSCGGGGGGGTPEPGRDGVPQARPFGTISGVAYDGPIRGGTVTAYEFTDAGKGRALATATTSNDGSFEVSVQSPDIFVLLEIRGGSYTEEATGVNVSLTSGSRNQLVMRSLVSYASGADHVSAITPYTNMAVGLVNFYLTQGGTLTDAAADGFSHIDQLAGFNVRSTMPLDITDTENAFSSLTDAAKYGYLLAAISQLTANLNEAADQTPHVIHTSYDFVALMYNDIVSDGELDGRAVIDGVSSELMYAGQRLTVETYRRSLATGLIGFMNSDNNAVQINAESALPFINAVAASTSDVFGGVPPQILDNEGPEITQPLSDNVVLNGIASFGVEVSDLVGVEQVNLYIDGVLVTSAETPAAPNFSFNTESYSNGTHTIRIEAIDLLQNSSSITFDVYFEPEVGIVQGKSFVKGGTVTIYSVDDIGAVGDLTSTGAIDSAGNFSQSLKEETGIYLIEVRNGSYTEASSGRNVTLGDGDVLTTLFKYTEGATVPVNVNLFTHVAAGVARFNATQDQSIEAAMDAARASVTAYFGFDPYTQGSVDVTNTENEFTTLNLNTIHGLTIAAVSQFAEEVSIEAGDNAHERYHSVSFAQVMYNDAVSDGVLNGAGKVDDEIAQLSLANRVITGNTYRTDLAASMVRFSQGARFALARTVAEILPFALNLQNSEEAFFSDTPIVAFDSEGPIILNPTGSNRYDETVEIAFSIEDPIGLDRTAFFLDGNPIDDAVAVTQSSITLNTELYADGDHRLTVESFDLLGNRGRSNYDVFFLPPAGELTGVAHDGPIMGGTVDAYAYIGGKGEHFATGTTNEKGDYALTLQELNTPIMLEVSGGRYIEEASGRTIRLNNGEYLNGMTFYEKGSQIDLQLTHYTHWATCMADYLISNQAFTVGNAVVQGNENFAAISGIQISSTKPIDITKEENFTSTVTDGHRYGFLLAAISKLTAEIAEANEVAPHTQSQYTSIHFSDMVCRDIKADGMMDGVGTPSAANPTGQLYIGTTPLSVHYYRTLIARNILEVAADPAINKVGITAPQLLDFANTYSMSADDIYAGVPPEPVDQEGPAITSTVAQNTMFAGTVSIPVTVSDPIGVSRVEFYVDDVFIGNGDLNALAAAVNTTEYSDGVHTLRVNAFDALNNESTFSLPLRFINTGADITITSSALTNQVAYTASGSYESVGAPIERITVNGVNAQLNQMNRTWSASVVLEAGFNEVTATVVDVLGNENSNALRVGVDLLPPFLDPKETIARYARPDAVTASDCDAGSIWLSTTPVSAVCLDALKTSLNGAPVASSLASQGYLLFAFDITDPSSGGVFTSVNDLRVEYRYSRNGNSIFDWRVFSRLDSSESRVIVPFTTEYFGNDFYFVGNDVVHSVEVKLIDRSGNQITTDVTFRLNVFTPEVQISDATLINPELFNTPFSNRTSVNTQNAVLEYTLTNDTAVPYYIQVTPGDANEVYHEWESAQRYRQAYLTGSYRTRYKFQSIWTETRNGRASIVCGQLRDWVVMNSLASLNANYSWESLSYSWPVTRQRRTLNSDQEPAPIDSPWESFFMVIPNVYAHSRDDNAHWVNVSGATAVRAGFTLWDRVVDRDNDYYMEVAYIEGGPCPSPAGGYAERSIRYRWENVPGYPRNEFRTFSATTNFAAGSVKAYIGTNQITATNGWLRIPANTTVRLVNSVRLPAVDNRTDEAVARNDSTVPYGQFIYLDKTLTWELDTTLTVVRQIAPSTGFSDQVTRATQIVESVSQSATISR